MPRALSFAATAGLAVALVFGLIDATHAPGAVALTGSVSSAAEGRMEGVLVSAQETGSTITRTVVTDEHGRYAFPASVLPPGRYKLRIRAAGYELGGPSSAVVGRETMTTDLRLTKARDLAAQLSDAEWLMSMPGSFDQKRDLNDCNSCHSLGRVVRSKFTADQFQTIILPRMAGGFYTNNTSPQHPQKKPGAAFVPNAKQLAMSRSIAEYLARINLSDGRSTWTYPLKTAPRPKGAATRVLITEYDLPQPDWAPHDVVVTRAHEVYFSDFHQQFIGELDPVTGKVTQYPTPVLKPGFPTGSLDLEYDPRGGNLWLAMMHQGAIARFDLRTKALQTWMIPAEYQNDVTQQAFLTVPSPVDGKLWIKDSARRAVYKFDPATGTFESFGPVIAADGHSIFNYGIYADSKNDMYGLDYPGFVYGTDRTNYVSHVDDQTGAMSSYMVPTHQSRPRRGRFDGQDRLWFAEFDGNNIGMFDARSKTFAEWPMPDPYTFPYDAVRDETGGVWTGSMFTDRVVRLDPATGATVSYLLPRSTNIRRVFFADGALWVGSNHGASIVRVQPLP
jgi:streptogramin lyase